MRKATRNVLFAVLAFVEFGCATSPEIVGARPPALHHKAWKGIHSSGAGILRCTVPELTATILDTVDNGMYWTHAVEIAGCGGTVIFVVTTTKMGAWAYTPDDDLRDKVKFMFGGSCPTATIEYIDPQTRGVTACDKKMIYVSSSSGWVVNSTVTLQPEAHDAGLTEQNSQAVE